MNNDILEHMKSKGFSEEDILIASSLVKRKGPKIIRTNNIEKEKNFSSSGHGFHIKFYNRYTISIQFGICNYADNRNMPIIAEEYLGQFADYERKDISSFNAEVAVFNKENAMLPINGDMVAGYLNVREVEKLMKVVMSLEEDRDIEGFEFLDEP